MSAKTIDADVGRVKIAWRVLRCLVFTLKCYRIVLAGASVKRYRLILLATMSTNDENVASETQSR